MRVPLLIALLTAAFPSAALAQDSAMPLPEVIERWVNVFQGSFDLEEYLDLFTDDVRFRDAQTGATLHGKRELTELIQPFGQLSDMSATVVAYAINGDTVFLQGELHATAPTGDPVVSRGVGVFTLAGGRISSAAMYMFRQNVSPSPPGFCVETTMSRAIPVLLLLLCTACGTDLSDQPISQEGAGTCFGAQ